MTHTFHLALAPTQAPAAGARITPPSRAKNDVWHAARKALAEKGETMRQCPTCLRFLWPDEMGKPK